MMTSQVYLRAGAIVWRIKEPTQDGSPEARRAPVPCDVQVFLLDWLPEA